MRNIVKNIMRFVVGTIFLALLAESMLLEAAEPRIHDVVKPDRKLNDARLKKPRHTRDKYHPWVPAGDPQAWETQKQRIKEQILVSNGLWPMPPSGELNPQIFGLTDRGDYTIEKVYFESHPGHYVTGNLYRPKNSTGKNPGVLCPHGHWANGRFFQASTEKANEQLSKSAEIHMSGAMYPVQARMAQLARLGCTVFHYDMVGYADSNKIGHGGWFQNVEAGLRLQNGMGLQTFNSLRALDFLMSLPEVDVERIAVTGSSGGGTQTFMLCAIDDRPDVAFPAVMVSTGMQGGCVCENASYLRQNINNVAIAALFAPKPMAMSGADDWTIDIETKGLPELKTVYGHYGKPELVHAKCFPQFGHNYNSVARNMMYDWMIEHLGLDQSTPFVEEDFWPLSQEQMQVFDAEHPLPENAKTGEELAEYMTAYSERQLKGLIAQPELLKAALRVMLENPVSELNDVSYFTFEETLNDSEIGSVFLAKGLISRKSNGAEIPYIYLQPETFNGEVVLWLDDKGKQHLFTEADDLDESARKLLASGYAIASIDVFLTGEYLRDQSLSELWQVDKDFHGYTFCFNKPLPAHRVGDLLSAVKLLQENTEVKKIHLVASGTVGACALLAGGLMDGVEKLTSATVDLDNFNFSKVKSTNDEMFLPGALKYGGLQHLGIELAPVERLEISGRGTEKPRSREQLIESFLK